MKLLVIFLTRSQNLKACMLDESGSHLGVFAVGLDSSYDWILIRIRGSSWPWILIRGGSSWPWILIREGSWPRIWLWIGVSWVWQWVTERERVSWLCCGERRVFSLLGLGDCKGLRRFGHIGIIENQRKLLAVDLVCTKMATVLVPTVGFHDGEGFTVK